MHSLQNLNDLQLMTFSNNNYIPTVYQIYIDQIYLKWNFFQPFSQLMIAVTL